CIAGSGLPALDIGCPPRTSLRPSDASMLPARLSLGHVEPSCCPIFFSSRTALQRPSISAPVKATIAPVRIRVLPKLNSLTGIPKPIATRPANRKQIPPINSAAAIDSSPACVRNARRPRMPRYCHIVHSGNRQSLGAPRNGLCPELKSDLANIYQLTLHFATIAASHQEITPQFPIT